MQEPLSRLTPLAITQPHTEGVVVLLDHKLRFQSQFLVPSPTEPVMVELKPEKLEEIIR